MILRRVIEHVKKQHWTAVFLDFVIVVAGVFIGIQVSNWNQYAGERRSETEYLKQLQNDLNNIQKEAAAQISFEQFHAKLANQVYDIIEHDTTADRTRKINVGLSELSVRRTLKAQSPTFLDLQGAGKLDIISDTALRTAIISYFYGSSRLEAALDKNNASFVDHGFNDFIRSMSIPPRDWDSNLMAADLPASSTLTSAFTDQAMANPIYAAGGGALAAPADAEIWEAIVPQLAWRGKIAIGNEAIAQRLKEATDDLEAKLARRLEGSAR